MARAVRTAATSTTFSGLNLAPCSMAFIRISRNAKVSDSWISGGKSERISLRKVISRSAVSMRQFTRSEIQPRRADKTSMSLPQLVSATACKAMSAISMGTKGAVKQTKTRARSAAMTSSGVLCGARTITFTPGRTERSSSRRARSSSTEVKGLVSTTSNDSRRMQRRASTSPAAHSKVHPALASSSPMERFSSQSVPIRRTCRIIDSPCSSLHVLAEIHQHLVVLTYADQAHSGVLQIENDKNVGCGDHSVCKDVQPIALLEVGHFKTGQHREAQLAAHPCIRCGHRSLRFCHSQSGVPQNGPDPRTSIRPGADGSPREHAVKNRASQ